MTSFQEFLLHVRIADGYQPILGNTRHAGKLPALVTSISACIDVCLCTHVCIHTCVHMDRWKGR